MCELTEPYLFMWTPLNPRNLSCAVNKLMIRQTDIYNTTFGEHHFGNKKPFKNDEKMLFIHLKSSFRSQDI